MLKYAWFFFKRKPVYVFISFQPDHLSFCILKAFISDFFLHLLFGEISLKISLSPNLLSKVRNLFDMLNFLNSTEEYQHKKDFSHLGTMTISRSHNGSSRTVTFNYTSNQYLNELAETFRKIATQETRIFELETVRTNDPISTPAQMRMLESELRSRNIADPQQLIPLLEELRLDEGVPLITRNHAERLIKMINKDKR